VVADGFWDVFHRSRSPMLMLDDDAVYTDANDAFCRAIARPREQVVGQRLGSLSTPERRAEAQAVWAELVARRHVVAGWTVTQPDGDTVGIEIVAAADLPGPGRHLAVCLPPSRAQPEGALSPREIEVTQLLARGLSGEQIAERLFLSPETVRTHIRNAMDGMGAHTRAQLVALALDSELITLRERPV
jgi:DNA-binding CsgD family transcriptional regulator